ncbi:MAG: oligosaccharide flippase family protein [Chloroflexi bacterium]|nr:oligosaccharide flippase family protein [Chloroflexota bacterium]
MSVGGRSGPLGRIGRETAVLLVTRVVAQALLVVATVLLAMRLGPAGFGRYAVIASAVLVANIVTTFGTDMVLIRELAGGRHSIRPIDALAVQLVATVPAIALLAIGAPLLGQGDPDAVAALRIASLSLVPAALFSVASAGLRGARRPGRYAALGIATAALQLAAVATFAGPGVSLVTVAWIVVGVGSATGVLAWGTAAATIGDFRRPGRFSTTAVWSTARASAPVGALALLGVACQRAALFGVALLAGPLAAGWFAAASRIVDTSKTGHVALYTTLYPMLAEANETRPSGAADVRALQRARDRSIVAAGGISALLIVGGPLIVDRLFGASFAPAAFGLGVLALALVPSAIASHRTIELLAVGAESMVGRALLASLATLIVLLAAFVPIVGWIGAAWAVVGAESVNAGLLVRVRVSPSALAERRAGTWGAPVGSLEGGSG